MRCRPREPRARRTATAPRAEPRLPGECLAGAPAASGRSRVRSGRGVQTARAVVPVGLDRRWRRTGPGCCSVTTAKSPASTRPRRAVITGVTPGSSSTRATILISSSTSTASPGWSRRRPWARSRASPFSTHGICWPVWPSRSNETSGPSHRRRSRSTTGSSGLPGPTGRPMR